MAKCKEVSSTPSSDVDECNTWERETRMTFSRDGGGGEHRAGVKQAAGIHALKKDIKTGTLDTSIQHAVSPRCRAEMGGERERETETERQRERESMHRSANE